MQPSAGAFLPHPSPLPLGEGATPSASGHNNAPGYVDEVDGKELHLTLFNEGSDIAKQLKAGKAIRVAPAGVDRKPTTAPLTGTVTATTTKGRECKVTLTLSAAEAKFQPTGLARLWLAGE